MNLRFLVALSMVVAAAAACESAANLDVSYRDTADSGPPANVDGGDAADPENPVVLEGCPCDPSQGLGCCVTAKDAFCTHSEIACAAEKGELIKCSKYDPNSQSECCWHGSGAGALAAYAIGCDGGPTACLTNADCPDSGKCSVNTCAGFQFGACGDTIPACPAP